MTRTPSRRSLAAGTALAVGLALLAGCTSQAPPPVYRDPVVPAGALRLVAFDSCADALAKLKRSAKEWVGPYGFGGGVVMLDGGMRLAAPAAEQAKSAAGAPAAGPGSTHSGTNTHEAGVDEPDLVKTDGRRIVTVNAGVLRVVDAATRKVTGRLDLRKGKQDPVQWGGADLLLQGDRMLVISRGSGYPGGPAVDVPLDAGSGYPSFARAAGPRLLLVDLSGAPRVLSEYRIDGGLVDARQVAATVRVVVRSAPRLNFPYRPKGTDAQRIAANRRIIDRASADAWLPRYQVTSGGRTTSGRLGCDRISRPATYSGTSLVSVLSFDLSQPTLGDGDAVSVAADGDTVYSNGTSLYVANDQRWRFLWRSPGDGKRAINEVTEIYKFDTSQPGRPRYEAAGSVKGWLVNQYSLSEWQGNLRVATTSGQSFDGRAAKSSSTVYVLTQQGGTLAETGKVTGLGKGEQIYAVRFAGPVGYVVTFRRTDPLYTVDLFEPAHPRVIGELKITGYSAYLHPMPDGRLIGVGQEASTEGRTQGTQVSLFDVSNLERAHRLAQYHVRSGYSEAEFDPHAFLYWPQDRLLVLPLTAYDPGVSKIDGAETPVAGAMVLRVTDGGFTERGMISHPNATGTRAGANGMIRRSLVVDDVLWTVSDAGLRATSMSTLSSLAWLPS